MKLGGIMKKFSVYVLIFNLIFLSVFGFNKIESHAADFALPFGSTGVGSQFITQLLLGLGMSVSGVELFTGYEVLPRSAQEQAVLDLMEDATIDWSFIGSSISDWYNGLTESDFFSGVATFDTGVGKVQVVDNDGAYRIGFDTEIVGNIADTVTANVADTVATTYTSRVTEFAKSTASVNDFPLSNIDSLTCEGMTDFLSELGIDVENSVFLVYQSGTVDGKANYYIRNVPFGYTYSNVQYINNLTSSNSYWGNGFVLTDSLLQFKALSDSMGLSYAFDNCITRSSEHPTSFYINFTVDGIGDYMEIDFPNNSDSRATKPIRQPQLTFNYSEGLVNDTYIFSYLIYSIFSDLIYDYTYFSSSVYSLVTEMDILNPDADLVIESPTDGFYDVALTDDVVDLATNPDMTFPDVLGTVVGQLTDGLDDINTGIGESVGILQKILDFLQNLLDAILGIPAAFADWFGSVIGFLSDIYDWIVNFSLTDTLEAFWEWLVVPADADALIENFTNYVRNKWDENDNVLLYPGQLLTRFFDLFINYDPQDWIMNIKPFHLSMPTLGIDHDVDISYSFNLTSYLRDDIVVLGHPLQWYLYAFTDCTIVFCLIQLLQKKLRTIILH